jgi:hypothetical protein
MSLPFYMIWYIFLIAFKILSLSCILRVLTVIWSGDVLFLFFLFNVLQAPCTWMTISFSRFGKFFSSFIEYFLCLLLVPLFRLLCSWLVDFVFQWCLRGLICSTHNFYFFVCFFNLHSNYFTCLQALKLKNSISA